MLFKLLPAALLPFVLTATGCYGGDPSPLNPVFHSTYPFKTLVNPSAEALQAAADFSKSFPSSRIFFSQNTGDLLWVDGGGPPLAQGAVDTAEHALSVVQNFMIQYPGLFRLSDPLHAFDPSSASLRTTGQAQGVVSLHFDQLQNSVSINGHYAMAIFDTAGNLLSLQTHLLASASLQAQLMASTSAQAPATPSGVPSARIQRRAPGLRQVWTDLDGSGKYRMIEEQVETSGIQVLRTLRDPETGALLKSRDETASDLVNPPKGWARLAPSLVAAHDTLGKDLQIFSTQASGALVLGFHLDGIHAPGMSANIADAGSSSNPSVAPVTPLATASADWESDPDFDSKLRAASTLALHLRTTLQWYKQNLGWASWDNKGTTIFTAIRGNRSGSTTPQLNAWGGGGMILIGDGLTATGQPLSDALDVVAHEFTHSIVYATTPFVYSGESGALNESLADIFGKTVQGFPDMIMGSQAGGHFRDLGDPENCEAPDQSNCAQPGLYSEYELIPETIDNAGVHTNSGIVNRALSQVIQAAPSTDGAATGRAPRGLALVGLILDSMTQGGFDTASTLEDFAAGLLAYCQARQQAGSLLAAQTGMCAQLEAAFMGTQLLTPPQP